MYFLAAFNSENMSLDAIRPGVTHRQNRGKAAYKFCAVNGLSLINTAYVEMGYTKQKGQAFCIFSTLPSKIHILNPPVTEAQH